MLEFIFWVLAICITAKTIGDIHDWATPKYQRMADAYLITKIKAKCLYYRITQ